MAAEPARERVPAPREDAPAPARGRLRFTRPTATSSLEPEPLVAKAPVVPPPPASLLPRSREGDPPGHTPRSRISFNAPAERPQRRLRLTVPTDSRLSLLNAREPAARPRMGEGTYLLPEPLLSALEEEWWRRQMRGEGWSRSEIVAAALSEILADPARLSAVLKRAVEPAA